MLRRFAQMMKWPNLADTLDHMKERDADGTLENISSDALAFFSSLVLPGVSPPECLASVCPIIADHDPSQRSLFC